MVCDMKEEDRNKSNNNNNNNRGTIPMLLPQGGSACACAYFAEVWLVVIVLNTE